MSDFIYDLLERRSRQKTSEFIFPADSKTGYIYDPKKAVSTVAELSGVKDVERLRKPIQQVTNFLLKYMMETAEID